MSIVYLGPVADELINTLYNLVGPMLASDDCVKCIVNDGHEVFTTDVQCLLVNLDIEHPGGELIIQALNAHKDKYGVGTKTLLFMITRLSRAISELRHQGISVKLSLSIIQGVMMELYRQIGEITIPATSIAFHSEGGCPELRQVASPDPQEANIFRPRDTTKCKLLEPMLEHETKYRFSHSCKGMIFSRHFSSQGTNFCDGASSPMKYFSWTHPKISRDETIFGNHSNFVDLGSTASLSQGSLQPGIETVCVNKADRVHNETSEGFEISPYISTQPECTMLKSFTSCKTSVLDSVNKETRPAGVSSSHIQDNSRLPCEQSVLHYSMHSFSKCCCHCQLMTIAKQVVQNQLRAKELKGQMETSFCPQLVNCLSLVPSWSSSSLQTATLRSRAPSVSVVQGLLIPCYTDSFESVRNEAAEFNRTSLLVNGDLTPGFHHIGYKPTLQKRYFIAKSHEESQAFDERAWSANVRDILKQLNVKMLFVRGKASSVLADMCLEDDVWMFTNVSSCTLIVLAHLHEVEMVTYITQTSQANLCSICVQPASAVLMEQLEGVSTAGQHYVIITSAMDIQTVVFHTSCAMTAQLYQERLWKCLYQIANTQADEQVLPGSGDTEMWCADKIRDKVRKLIGSQLGLQQSVVLDAVAEVFYDYASRVKLNIQHKAGLCSRHTQGASDINESTLQRLGATSLYPTTCCANHGSCVHDRNILTGVHNEEDVMSMMDCTCLQPPYPTTPTQTRKMAGSSESLNINIQGNSTSDCVEIGRISQHLVDIHACDNYEAKISAWSTALDVISALLGLGSVIISRSDDWKSQTDFAVL